VSIKEMNQLGCAPHKEQVEMLDVKILKNKLTRRW